MDQQLRLKLRQRPTLSLAGDLFRSSLETNGQLLLLRHLHSNSRNAILKRDIRFPRHLWLVEWCLLNLKLEDLSKAKEFLFLISRLKIRTSSSIPLTSRTGSRFFGKVSAIFSFSF